MYPPRGKSFFLRLDQQEKMRHTIIKTTETSDYTNNQEKLMQLFSKVHFYQNANDLIGSFIRLQPGDQYNIVRS